MILFFLSKKFFVPNGQIKVEGSVEFIYYQPTELNVLIELESRRIWLTDVYYRVFLMIM